MGLRKLAKLLHPRRNSLRETALADIRGYVISTSLSSVTSENKFRLFGLTGSDCHELVIVHTKMSPYTLTNVGVRKNTDKDRFVNIMFYWSGVHIPRDMVDAAVASFANFFPDTP